EVAKFRAARRLWCRITKDRFGATDARSTTLRFHTQTGGSTLTAQSPENNMVRVAVQALAATLGGTQSLHTNSYDEALGLPTEKAARLALRTQQVLAYETGVANTVDPFAGSYFLETLTNELEAEAQEYLRKIEAMGGMLKAIERGWVQQEIQDAAYRAQRELETKKRILVGVNEHVDEAKHAPEIMRIDSRVEAAQIEKVRRLRKDRDARKWEKAVRALEKAAEGTENLMPFILDASKAYATTGEVCNTLRKVFGEYKAPAVV
ncbi:MAG TPA: methylmalonyl-CoA mutase family protein, partial [Candidatus Thermoplasmatota archaeon]|nr:methylmalonyl-CoA mutase family protein [Candidatus Thermoplasmatota archaeon]